MRKFIFLFTLTAHLVSADAQNVSISTDASAPHASAILDIKSNNKGLLIPNMSSAQRNDIVGPATGLLVYDLDKKTIFMWAGNGWMPFLFSTSLNNIPAIPVTASNGQPGNQFGSGVSFDGSFAIVGAPGRMIAGNVNQGVAYIFQRIGSVWQEMAMLTANDGGAGHNFGTSVSISGDYAAIGATKYSGTYADQGAVYIFHRIGNNWVQENRLSALSPAAGDQLGKSVCINGDYLIAGASNSSSGNGKAFIYKRSTGTIWGTLAVLSPSVSTSNTFFGFSVSISGDYALVGAPGEEVNNIPQRGAGYIYKRNGNFWNFLSKIGEGTAGDSFGAGVSIDGNYIAIGATRYANPAGRLGCAYVYIKGAEWINGQAFHTRITPDDSEITDISFGNSVRINQTLLLVGASVSTVAGIPLHGVANIYQRYGTSWQKIRNIKDDNGEFQQLFGASVSLYNNEVLIGAPGKYSGKGAVFFLNIEQY